MTPGRAWLMALRHPPLTLGLPNLDEIALAPEWAGALWDVIASRPPAAILCGHVRGPIHGTWRGVPFHIQRAVYHHVAYAPARQPRLIYTEAPAALSDIRLEVGDLRIHTRELAPDCRRYTS